MTYYTQNYPEMAWAVFFAGGSCPALPVKDVDLLNDAAKMLTNETDGTYWQMGKNGIGCIVYSLKGGNITLNLDSGRYVLKSVNMKTGEVKVLNKNLNIKGIYILDVSKAPDCIYWFDKK